MKSGVGMGNLNTNEVLRVLFRFYLGSSPWSPPDD
jgi:hypothetical protein